MASVGRKPGIGTYLAVAISALVFWGTGFDLTNSRDFLGELDAGNHFTGVVASDADTLESPYFKTPSVMYRALEEKGSDDDDSISWSTLSDALVSVPFGLETDEGYVSVVGKAEQLQYPSHLEPQGRKSRYLRLREWTVRPGDHVTVRGRPHAGQFAGPVRLFRGTPAQWRSDVEADAAGTLVIMVLALLVFAGFGGFLAWRYIGLVLGEPTALIRLGTLTRDIDTLAEQLMRVDVHWLERPRRAEAWWVGLGRLALASPILAVYLVAVGWATSTLAPVFWGGLSPFSGEGTLRLEFLNFLTAGAVLLTVVWGLREAVSMYYQQHASPASERVSDTLLQLCARLRAAGAQRQARLDFREDRATLKVRMGGEQLVVLVVEAHERLRVTATGEGQALGGKRDALTCTFEHRDGLWFAGDQEVDAPVAAADALWAWLTAHGVGRAVQLRQHMGQVSLQRGTVQHSELPAHWAADLVPPAHVGLAPLPRTGGVWRTRNADSLLYLAGALAMVAAPTALAFAMTMGWVPTRSTWVVLLPLSLIPGVALLFRPPVFGPLRSRQVRMNLERVSLSHGALRAGDRTVDLSEPFRVHLTRDGGDGSDGVLLGVELRQAQGGRDSGLRFTVPLHADSAEDLPRLDLAAPLMKARDFLLLWPGLRVCAQSHGVDVAWSAEATDLADNEAMPGPGQR